MLTQNDVLETVRNYTHDIESHGVILRTVILYGSFAKGTHHEWSDIDVALVSDKFTGMPEDHDLLPYIGIKKPYVRIEAKTYPTSYFYHGNDPFIDEIIHTGIKIK